MPRPRTSSGKGGFARGACGPPHPLPIHLANSAHFRRYLLVSGSEEKVEVLHRLVNYYVETLKQMGAISTHGNRGGYINDAYKIEDAIAKGSARLVSMPENRGVRRGRDEEESDSD